MRRIANIFLRRDSNRGSRPSQRVTRNTNVIPDVKPIDSKNPFHNLIINEKSCRSEGNISYTKANKIQPKSQSSRSENGSSRSVEIVCIPTTSTARSINMHRVKIEKQNNYQRSFKRGVLTRSRLMENSPSSVTKHLQIDQKPIKSELKLATIRRSARISRLDIRKRAQYVVKSESIIPKLERKETQRAFKPNCSIAGIKINSEENNQHSARQVVRKRSQRIKNRIENNKVASNFDAKKSTPALKRRTTTEIPLNKPIKITRQNSCILVDSGSIPSKATRPKLMENHLQKQRQANGKLDKKKVQKSPLHKVNKSSTNRRRKYTFKTMINTSIREIGRNKPNGGVSYYAIKEYLAKNYFIDIHKSKHHIKNIILSQLELGELVRLTGKTVWGTYRFPTEVDKKKLNAKKRKEKLNKAIKKKSQKINLKSNKKEESI